MGSISGTKCLVARVFLELSFRIIASINFEREAQGKSGLQRSRLLERWIFLFSLFFAFLALEGGILSEFISQFWRNDDGLPQSSVIAISQSPNGYLWFGTFNGLARFDGVKFGSLETGDVDTFQGDAILSVYFDRLGRLWYVNSGLDLWRFENGVQSQITITGFIHRSDSRGPIREDSKGALWLVGKPGIMKWNGREFEPVPMKLSSGDPLPPEKVNISFGQNRIWMASGSRLGELKDGVFLPEIELSEHGILEVEQMESAREGGLWFVGNGNGLSRLYYFELVEGEAKPSLEFIADTGGFFCLLADRNGGVWMGSHGRGLYRAVRSDGGGFDVHEPVLQGEIIRSLFQDHEGSVWVGTDGAGVHRFTPRLFRTHVLPDTNQRSMFYSLAVDSRGRLWAGTYDRGLYQWDGHRLIPQHKDINLPNINWIWTLDADRKGGIWIGTYGEGLHYFDGTTARPIDLRPLKSNPMIYAIKQDRRGDLWFGTGNGLFKWDGGSVTQAALPVEGDSSSAITSIEEDSVGDLWAGSLKQGLFQITQGRIQRHGMKEGLPSNSIYCLYADSRGDLWIGTKGMGLARMRGGRVQSFASASGLPCKVICGVIEDSHGNLWIGSYEGIYRAARRDLEDFADGRIEGIQSFSYDAEDGLLTRECSGGTQSSVCRTSDGRLWFATVNGLGEVDPNRLRVNNHPPPVVIEKVVMDAKPVWLNREIFLPRGSSGDSLAIPPGNHAIEIHFTGLSFASSSKVRFRYRLDGVDSDWVDSGSRRVAFYSNVPPGNYRFRVKAANKDWVWNESGDAIGLVFLPHVWQTFWFRGAAAITFLLGLYAFYQMRVRYLKARHAEQEMFSRSLIESQEKERKHIAAELHDSLGQNLLLMKNWMDLAVKKLTAKGTESKDIETASQMMTQSIQELRNITYHLRPYQLDRLGLSKAIQSVGRSFSQAGSFKVEFQLDAIDRLLDSEVEIQIYRIVQEACNNAHKHANPQHVWISCRVKNGGTTLALDIEDDGRGFDLEEGERGKVKARSFGLLGMRERVRILNGQLEVHSTLGRGTRISVQIPIPKSKGPV